jgi:hypothetical protein
MPSSAHEGVIELFRQQPDLAATLLHTLGMDVPAFQQTRLEPEDLTDLRPTEFRADTVVTLRDPGAKPVLGVIAEVQLGRDGGKRWSWPAYLATLRARLQCPVMLLVVCVDRAAAAWCATPIELGHPGLVLRPLVFGPNQVPLVTDVDQVRKAPELAILSAAAHADHPDSRKTLYALTAGLSTEDPNKAVQYIEIAFAVLPAVARRYLEDLMSTQTFEFQSDYARRLRAEGEARGEAKGEARGEARGEAKGEARLVLAVLDARGIDVPDDVRDRVTASTDPDQLEAWGRRAAVIHTIGELFDRGP